MKELTCIVCPKGCRLKVDEENDYRVTGFSCQRGEEYGRQELLHPTRVLTSTVRITGGLHARLPVKSGGVLPKEMLFEAMRLLDAVSVQSPVKAGQVIVPDILGTGVPWIATRSM